MLLYCDSCGRERNLDLTDERVHGECEICRRRLGKMNVLQKDELDEKVNNVKKEVWECCGLKVQQIKGVLPNTPLESINPGMSHRIIGPDRVLYFDARKMIIVSPSTGKQVQISF